MIKFNIGDRVRAVIVKLDDTFKVGWEGTVVDHSHIPDVLWDANNDVECADEGQLELIIRTPRPYEVGDVLYKAGDTSDQSLDYQGAIGKVLFFVDEADTSVNFTQHELHLAGWKLKEEPTVKELTDEISKKLGYEVKVVRKSRAK